MGCGCTGLGLSRMPEKARKTSSRKTGRKSRRPPKKWWGRCVAGVRASGSARSPEEVCGSEWYHKMSPAKKAAAVRRERRTTGRKRTTGKKRRMSRH